jgi:hypothetical protein
VTNPADKCVSVEMYVYMYRCVCMYADTDSPMQEHAYSLCCCAHTLLTHLHAVSCFPHSIPALPRCSTMHPALRIVQAHSRRNGSEFVLLRNFATSAPPTPTAAAEAEAAADTPNTASTPTAAAATAAADSAAGVPRADVQQHEAVAGFGAAPSGFDAAPGSECKPGAQCHDVCTHV